MELSRNAVLSPLIRWLVASLTALLLTLPALEGLDAATADHPAKPRTLSFAERVAAQRAIEEVLWRHRIWPQENPGPKPSLDQILPDAVLRGKVTDYLKKSSALEKLWGRPITAAQMQAEMERMAKNSRQPEVLREILSALHDDPFLIAETLARPALAGRILHNTYVTDRLLHQAVRAQAESDVARFDAPGLMRAMQGEYREKTWYRAEPDAGGILNPDHLTPAEFDGLLESLREQVGASEGATPSELPMGKIGPLRETEDSFGVAAILSRGTDSIRIASVTWSKKPFDAWWKEVRGGLSESVSVPGSRYESVSLEAAGCTDDTWRPTGETSPTARFGHTAVWTGSEMIIWGGGMGSGSGFTTLRSGSRYNPATDTWTTTFNDNDSQHVPTARSGHLAVWTGSKMIVWSGASTSPGGIYDPLTDSWDLNMGLPSTNPAARISASAVWTGTEMIVWGGMGGPGVFNTGGRFNPSAHTWTATSIGANVPAGRFLHSAVWTGSEMIVWGGRNSTTTFNSGGRYDPVTNSWTPTGTGANVPSPRQEHTAVWTGTEMIVWGGRETSPFNDGARYDPSLDAWSAIPADPETPSPRYKHTAVWTGSKMVVWGGTTASGETNTGSRFDPSTGDWSPTLATPLISPQARSSHTAVWTGTEMIIWGGLSSAALGDGWRYNPQTDSWLNTALVLSAGPRSGHSSIWTGTEMIVWGGHEPVFFNNYGSGSSFQAATAAWEYVGPGQGLEVRSDHTVVWTGTEMIIWGGWDNSELGTGGRFNPSTGAWTLTSNEGSVPSARREHTAVWTGTEMIVWGGSRANDSLANGSRYDPSGNTWTPVASTGAPSPRAYHTALWTGSEMIVWGGYGPNSTALGDGSRYDPSTNGWSPVADSGAPAPRANHTAVWTGTEMIVWGGFAGGALLGTGGRYDLSTDSWTATNPASLEPRGLHSAVWTGHEMIVFGGSSGGADVLSHLRYNPSTDSWSPISTVSSVSLPRSAHTAVWTGEEMIVYGGTKSQNGARYCRLCPTLYSYYADQDGDTFGDAAHAGSSCDAAAPSGWSSNASDCSDADGGAWGSPGEVSGLQVGLSSPTEVTWDSQSLQSGAGTGYDVVGGYIFATEGFLNYTAGSCLQAGSSSASVIDTDPDPGPQVARWYLARARNSCSIGTYGTGSSGSNRNGSIPACP
jgi:N-acetylneuraminic acid mutarotase